MTADIVALSSDLYEFIRESETPLASRRHTLALAKDRVLAAVGRIASRFSAPPQTTPLLDDARRALVALTDELRQLAPAPERLHALWKSLGTIYEALRAHARRLRLPEAETLAPIKPRNFTRNIFHATMAMTGVLLYQFVFTRVSVIIFTGVLFGLFVALEIIRRRSPTWNRRFVDRMFKAIIRPGEVHQVPASTWYMGALFIGCIIYPQHAIQLGVLVLGFGDPLAQIIGKRYGKRKLVGQKSVVGTLAFIVAATAVGFVFLSLVAAGGPPAARLGIAAAAAFVGALAELFSDPLDDNFTIPLAAGALATLLLAF